MPATEVSICNLALSEIGEERILSLDEETTPARWCKEVYEATRDELLRLHPWNFAIDRQKLSRISEAPAFGWNFQYQLPANCLRPLQFNEYYENDYQNWIVEGRSILTNETTANLRFIQRISDCSKFDALFVQALSLAVASKICVPIRGDANLASAIVTKLERLSLPKARTADAQEGRPKYRPAWQNSALVQARFRRRS